MTWAPTTTPQKTTVIIANNIVQGSFHETTT